MYEGGQPGRIRGSTRPRTRVIRSIESPLPPPDHDLSTRSIDRSKIDSLEARLDDRGNEREGGEGERNHKLGERKVNAAAKPISGWTLMHFDASLYRSFRSQRSSSPVFTGSL